MKMKGYLHKLFSSTEKIQFIRLIAGFIISPLIMPLVIYLTFLGTFGFQNYNSETTLTSAKTIVWVYYLIVLICGVPAWYLMRRKGYESLVNYSILGAITGILLIITISNNVVFLFYIIFGTTGALAGLCFWYIAIVQKAVTVRRGRRSRRRSRTR